jgi:hypothetical protein
MSQPDLGELPEGHRFKRVDERDPFCYAVDLLERPIKAVFVVWGLGDTTFLRSAIVAPRGIRTRVLGLSYGK